MASSAKPPQRHPSQCHTWHNPIYFRFLLFLTLSLSLLQLSSSHFGNFRDEFSTCNCPANDPSYNADNANADTAGSARIAYLISVHNKRTLHDGAYLLKALMETSYPGNTVIILIHVDKRVGIASRTDAAKGTMKRHAKKIDGEDDEAGDEGNEGNGGEEDNKNKYLYYDSPLRRYVDVCLATPACTSNGHGNAHDTDGKSSRNANATILEVTSHFSPEWSKWSMNDPTLWAMDFLLHYPKLHQTASPPSDSSNSSHTPNSSNTTLIWDIFINLSGDTLPTIPAHRISHLFSPHQPLHNTNFLTSSSCRTGLLPTSIFHFPKGWMKRAHYFQRNIPKTLSYFDYTTGEYKEKEEVTIHFGSQWMALTSEFVEFVVRSMDHPNGLGNVLKEVLIETGVLMTDETFFATMLMNAPQFQETLPKVNALGALEKLPSMYSIRYERMDENLPDPWGEFESEDSLYDIPAKFAEVTGGEGPARPWGPYFLGTYDLGAIRDSGALFVRKVSWTVDENLVRMLPVRRAEGDERLEWEILPDLRWPVLGVNVKDPFVWAWEEKVKKAGEEK